MPKTLSFANKQTERDYPSKLVDCCVHALLSLYTAPVIIILKAGYAASLK